MLMQVPESWRDAPIDEPLVAPGGALAARRSIGAFQISERVHSAGAGIPLHIHETACLCYAVRGSFTEGIRGRAYRCGPFEVVLKPPREPHWDAFAKGPVTLLSVSVAEPRFAQIRECTGLFRTPQLDSRTPSRLLAHRVYEAFRLQAPATDLML